MEGEQQRDSKNTTTNLFTGLAANEKDPDNGKRRRVSFGRRITYFQPPSSTTGSSSTSSYVRMASPTPTPSPLPPDLFNETHVIFDHFHQQNSRLAPDVTRTLREDTIDSLALGVTRTLREDTIDSLAPGVTRTLREDTIDNLAPGVTRTLREDTIDTTLITERVIAQIDDIIDDISLTSEEVIAKIDDTSLIPEEVIAQIDDTSLIPEEVIAQIDDTSLTHEEVIAQIDDTSPISEEVIAQIDDTSLIPEEVIAQIDDTSPIPEEVISQIEDDYADALQEFVQKKKHFYELQNEKLKFIDQLKERQQKMREENQAFWTNLENGIKNVLREMNQE